MERRTRRGKNHAASAILQIFIEVLFWGAVLPRRNLLP
jgi:hypothetical protein